MGKRQRKKLRDQASEYKSTFDSAEWMGYGTPTYGGQPTADILPSKEAYFAALQERKQSRPN
jgi:hypothetical protein